MGEMSSYLKFRVQTNQFSGESDRFSNFQWCFGALLFQFFLVPPKMKFIMTDLKLNPAMQGASMVELNNRNNLPSCWKFYVFFSFSVIILQSAYVFILWFLPLFILVNTFECLLSGFAIFTILFFKI